MQQNDETPQTTPEQREQRNRLLSARYNLMSERRQIALDLYELDTESMPVIAADYQQHIDALTRQIQRIDARIAELERQTPQQQTETTEE